MATTIDAVAAVRGGLLQSHSARRLANGAARAALDRAGLAPAEIDLLINAGLYRDRNLGEPAMAALIQEDIDANPEDPHEGAHGTFSFDVANGACGVLTALQLADGFLRAGTIRHALIVASDANPGYGLAPGFPFTAAGGAAVVGFTEGPAGLAGLRWVVEEDGRELFGVDMGFDRGRNVLRVNRRAGFADRAAACAAKAAADVLGEYDVALHELELVVASPLEAEYLAALSGLLGLSADQLVTVERADRVHTAALVMGIETAVDQGRWAAARTILLISGGGGVTAGAALFVQ